MCTLKDLKAVSLKVFCLTNEKKKTPFFNFC